MVEKKLPELFDCFEKDLRRKVESKDDPFLGIFVEYLSDATKKNILKCLRQAFHPIDSLIANLFYYPALSATLVVDELLNRVGQNGYFEVYPIFEEMLGEKIQSTSKRTELWNAFRNACMRLGLEVSTRKMGTHFMVEDYLRQAGLPIAYVDDFALKAVRFADEIGIPEEDDHESLAVWQKGLIERLNSPFPKVAKKAIQRDHHSYYSNVFVRLFRNPPGEVNGLSKLERTILETCSNGAHCRKVRGLSIPEIVIRDLEYGVLLPAGAKFETKWHLRIDGGDNTSYVAYDEERFIPFESNLPRHIEIKRGETRWSKPLWDDIRNNRLLIFSLPSGRFVRCASLADKIVDLEPGDYALLLRFRPNDDQQLEMFSESPELFLRTVTVLPGIAVVLQRGPATFCLEGIDIPALTWSKKPLRGVRGNEVFPVKGLSIGVIIPSEYLENNKEYTLRLVSISLGENIDIDVNVHDDCLLEIDLEPYLNNWRPGVARLVASLHLRGSLKILAKKSAIIWNGLARVDRRILFHCSALPVNFDSINSTNTKVDNDRNVITYENDTNRFFKFAFRDGNVLRYFTWSVPGIFLNLISYREEGSDERSLSLGSVVSVSKLSRKTIKIFASINGKLKLGDFEVDVDFTRVGSKSISLASLMEYSSPGNNALILVDRENGNTITLLELVTPSTLEKYVSETSNGLRTVCIKSVENIEGLRIEAKNMLDGEKRSIEVNVNAGEPSCTQELVSDVKVTIKLWHKNEVYCLYPIKKWPEGMWIIKYQLKCRSRWGVAMNKNSEEIAESVLSSPTGYALRPEEIFNAFCSSSTLEQKVEVLLNIHMAMMSRFAEECWPQVSWLREYWSGLCVRFIRFAEDPSLWEKLLRGATEWPEESIADGHVTTSILSGYLLNMFCFERSFVPVNGQINNSLLSCMAIFPKLGNLHLLLQGQIIDNSVLFGFENAALIHRVGEIPRKFSMSRYFEALKNFDCEGSSRLLLDEQWVPSKGIFLSSLHYRYALRGLNYRYLRSASVISERRGRVLGIIRQINHCDLSYYAVDRRFENFTNNIDLGMFVDGDVDGNLLSEEDIITQEHLKSMVRFISFIAQICRAQSRCPGVLQAFIKEVQQKCDMSNNHVSGNLGYLLFLGEDLFAFYLMLWEVIFSSEYDNAVETHGVNTRTRRYVRN